MERDDDAPGTVRAFTPKEIRELLRLADEWGISVRYDHDWYDTICAVRETPSLRATLTRYCELAEMLEDAPKAALSGDLTPQMHDEDCDHDDPIGLAICEMDTAVGQAELIATEDDEVAAIIISAWERLKVALFETHTEDAQEEEARSEYEEALPHVDFSILGDQEEQ